MTFRVVAEKSHGIRGAHGRLVNPFRIRNIFAPNPTVRIERRTWDAVEAADETELRRLFDEATTSLPDMAGFAIVAIERMPDATSEAT